MNIFLFNFEWMIPNMALAGLGFLFGILYLNSKHTYLKIPLFVLWFLFLPNTIYLVTDIQHYFPQILRTDWLGWILLTGQYLFLILFGILSYFAGMIPMEKFFKRKKINNYSWVFLIFNFAIAFAVVLGKIERTHSWYVFTQPLRVISDILDVFTKPMLILFVVGFGVFLNLIYFAFRKRLSRSL